MKRWQLNRMNAARLAEYASNQLNLPERQCYRFEGGPLPKRVLIYNIETRGISFAIAT